MIGRLEMGYAPPYFTFGPRMGQVRPYVDILAIILEKPLFYLFPRYICDIERNRDRRKNLTNEEITDILMGSHSLGLLKWDVLNKWATAEIVREALANLTPREEAVLRQLYGIGIEGEQQQTFQEVATRFEVTRERVRQVEAKALRKLRHPSRTRILRGKSLPKPDPDRPDPWAKFNEWAARKKKEEKYRTQFNEWVQTRG